jgi:hypothetical protein
MPLLNTVSPQDAQGEVKKAYAIFEQIGIPVPLPMQMLSVSPDYLSIQGNLVSYFMRHPSLSPLLLAHIRLVVAHEENYPYCVQFNKEILKIMGDLSEEQIAVVTEDPSAAELKTEEKALLMFVQKVVRDPASTRTEDMQALKALGWSDRDIFDATLMGINMVGTGMMFKAFKMGE